MLDENDLRQVELLMNRQTQNLFNNLAQIFHELEYIRRQIGNLEFDLKPIDKEILNLKLENFSLSIRTMNILKKLDVRTIKDLCTISQVDLLKVAGCGRTVLCEVDEFLKKHSLRLGMGT